MKQRLTKFYLSIALIVILIIAWPVPQFPQAGLDGSWRIALSQLNPVDFQSVPVIFAYGMWGDLVRGAFIKENAIDLIFFRSVVYGVYAGLLLTYLYTSKSIWFAWVTFFLGALAASMSLFMPYFQTEFELAIMPLLILCCDPLSKHLNKVIPTLSALSGFIFFTKTSLYYYIFPVTILYAFSRAYLLSVGSTWSRLFKATLKVFQCALLSFGSIFLFSIIGSGSPFIQFSLLKDISSGYSAGMNSSGPGSEIILACILGLVIFFSSIYVVNISSLGSSRKALLARIIPSFYVMALSFKHAFVRHGHAPRFFVIQSFVFLALFSGLTFVQTHQQEMRATRAQLITVGSFIFSLAASILIPVKYMIVSFDFYGDQFRRHADAARAFWEAALGHDLFPAKALSLPSHRRLTDDEVSYIGSKTVDVIPGEVSIPYFYNFDWMPRPTLQSYQGYTLQLDKLNAKHLTHSGPEIVLFHQDAIDYKHVSFFSPSEYQSFVCNYQRAPLAVQAWRSPPLDIFERLDRSRCSSSRLMAQGRIRFNHSKKVQLPATPGLLVLKLHIKPTWLGRLAELSLRAPKLEIKLAYAKRGDIDSKIIDKNYAFSYRNAANGLTLWPDSPVQIDDLLSDCYNQYDDCRLDNNVVSFSVTTNAPWFFDDKFTYEAVYLQILR